MFWCVLGFHRWSPWERKSALARYVFWNPLGKVHVEEWQERTCQRPGCLKYQREDI